MVPMRDSSTLRQKAAWVDGSVFESAESLLPKLGVSHERDLRGRTGNRDNNLLVVSETRESRKESIRVSCFSS
jgi:hypothetical protein